MRSSATTSDLDPGHGEEARRGQEAHESLSTPPEREPTGRGRGPKGNGETKHDAASEHACQGDDRDAGDRDRDRPSESDSGRSVVGDGGQRRRQGDAGNDRQEQDGADRPRGAGRPVPAG